MTEPGAAPEAPDLRILQANERTLLAWIRTGLALMGFGFLLARVGLWLQALNPAHAHDAAWVGASFIALGAACNVLGPLRFVKARRAIVEGRPIIPGAAAAVTVALILAALGGLLVAYVLVQ
jgi:putative membrane protein